MQSCVAYPAFEERVRHGSIGYGGVQGRMAWPWFAKRGAGHENKKAHIAADFFRLVSSVLPYFERRS